MPLPEWDPLGSAKNAIQAHSNDPFTVENYCCLCLLVVFSTICWHISFEHSCPQSIFAIQPHDTKRLIAQHTRQKCILLHCNRLSSLDISSSKEATTNLSLKLMRVSMMFFWEQHYKVQYFFGWNLFQSSTTYVISGNLEN